MRAVIPAVSIARVALVAIAALGTRAEAQPVRDALEKNPDLVDAGKKVKQLQVELRYATAHNFMRKNVYGDLDRCYLNHDAAAMLADAQDTLMRRHPDYRLRVYDCARPARVQLTMWDIVRGTPSQKYVASPKNGSIHSYGCAVDLTVATVDGTPLDMGTPYDHFGPEAEPQNELELLEAGRLGPDQLANRLILREVMLRAGFKLLRHEWWHYDCATQSQTRRRYRQIP
jgi:D-alanyl-D-alanine dipeptidase